jgi:ABC-type branched-subunit amino acid transport system ATPase component
VDEVYGHLAALRDETLAIILVEETPSRAFAFADQAIVLRNGRIVLSGDAGIVARDTRLSDAYLGGLH